MRSASDINQHETVRRVWTPARTALISIDAQWATAGSGISWFSASHEPCGHPLQYGGKMFSYQPLISSVRHFWKIYPADAPPPDPQYGYAWLIFEWVDSNGDVINEAAAKQDINALSGQFVLPVAAPLEQPSGLKQRIDFFAGNEDGLEITITMGITQAMLWLGNGA